MAALTFLICLLSFIHYNSADIIDSFSPLNEFDEYHADECQRVRKPWNKITQAERDLFINGLLKLRELGGGDPSKDELVAIASEHSDLMQLYVHSSSDYLFWHGYLVWELESRIRNLGDEYKCFGMPYWDFSYANNFNIVPKDTSPISMFEGQGLGTLGDPDNKWTVNEYSWPYTREQYWVPTGCTAEGDEWPICSLKRASSVHRVKPASFFGAGIMDHPDFAEFSKWYAAEVGIPREFLVRSDELDPTGVSYDPIWFLFHSMVSYHQAMWTDCNDYDLLSADELDEHLEAYSSFCDEPGWCDLAERGLDDAIQFGGRLARKEWAYINTHSLTVRDRFHMPRWNVIYDLNGDDFFLNSGMKDYCEGKLSADWFMFDDTAEVNRVSPPLERVGDKFQIEEINTEASPLQNKKGSKKEQIYGSQSKKATKKSKSAANVYDTYNDEECQRVRRPWNVLTQEERQIYIDGVLELRKRGNQKLHSDEFIGVASAHDDAFGGITHHDSDYVFWHGYLVWELESRLRNLGGKYACFGMPYWDYTNEYGRPEDELPYIFSTGLGGNGDPNDVWKVNGYSWDITIAEWWTPYEQYCLAEGDEYPICSLKRNSLFSQEETAAEVAKAGIIDSADFATFSRWIAGDLDIPKKLFNKDSAYDPIWYLYHSTESYYQSLWVDCHDFDLIDSADLTDDGVAFSAYCDLGDTHKHADELCIDIRLDDALYFPNLLKGKPWSYIHSNDLTIRKLYKLPEWNIIYDVNGDHFFETSGVSEFCEGKMNDEWFIKPRMEMESENESSVKASNKYSVQQMIDTNFMVLAVIISVCIGVIIWYALNVKKNPKSLSLFQSGSQFSYGSTV